MTAYRSAFLRWIADGLGYEGRSVFWRELGPDGRLRNLNPELRDEVIEGAWDSLDLGLAFAYSGA